MKNCTFRHDILPLKDMLFRVALRIVTVRQDAEDIVQETLLKVWNRRDSWDNIESMEAWCVSICRNLALDTLRKRGIRQVAETETIQQQRADNSPTPLEETHHNDRVIRVRELIDTLPEKQRTCLQLRDVEGKSYKEIADILGITQEQVKVNIFRGRQTVRNRYQKIDEYGL